MKMSVVAALAAVCVTSVALAYDIHHPNIRDALGAADVAIGHIKEAQADNRHVEFGGHAEKAIAALEHAKQELIEADRWNDAHHH